MNIYQSCIRGFLLILNACTLLGVHYFFIRKCSIGKKSFCSNRVIFHMARTNIFPIYCTVSNTFCLDFNQWHTLINVSCKTASN